MPSRRLLHRYNRLTQPHTLSELKLCGGQFYEPLPPSAGCWMTTQVGRGYVWMLSGYKSQSYTRSCPDICQFFRFWHIFEEFLRTFWPFSDQRSLRKSLISRSLVAPRYSNPENRIDQLKLPPYVTSDIYNSHRWDELILCVFFL